MGNSKTTKKSNNSKMITLGEQRVKSTGPNRPARVRRSRHRPQTPPEGVRKQPRQQRSKQMVQDILQAAAETFARLGYARTTTNRIAARAGVSVGSLYQYFPHKDSLLMRLLTGHHAEVHQVIDRALEQLADPGIPLEKSLRKLLTELTALHAADPSLTKALSAAVLRESPAVDELHKEQDVEHLQRVSTLLAERPDVRQGDHRAMAALLGQTIGQLTRWLVHDTPAGIDHTTLLEELVQLLTRYLRK